MESIILIYILLGYAAGAVLTTLARLIYEWVTLGMFFPNMAMIGLSLIIWPRILQLWIAAAIKERHDAKRKRESAIASRHNDNK